MCEIPQTMLDVRYRLSEQYLIGEGIEIGALHHPMHVSPSASIKYLDRLSCSELRRHYPELAELPLVEPDLIEDGETLLSIPDGSLDFIIANHMLEHCENPLGALSNHLARLKVGGVLYYAIPDKRYSFDVDRELTPFEHLVNDFTSGPETSRLQHYREWATQVNKLTDAEEIERNISDLARIKYSIHFHVWDEETFRDFLVEARKFFSDAFSEITTIQNESEVITLLRKTGDDVKAINELPK